MYRQWQKLLSLSFISFAISSASYPSAFNESFVLWSILLELLSVVGLFIRLFLFLPKGIMSKDTINIDKMKYSYSRT